MSDTFFDMSALSAKHSGPDAAKRARKRHRAEWRLKAYGVLAIMLAAAALVILIYTIAAKTLAVTSEYYLSLDVELEASERQIATLTDGDPATTVDLKKPLRNALKEAARTELKGRKARPLHALLSKFEGYELGEIAEANPDLLGERYHFEALLDDDVQLYLKGQFGKLEDAGASGTLTLSQGEDDLVIGAISPGALGPIREAMRRDRADEERVLRRSARDQARAFDETEQEFERAADDAEKTRLQSLID